MVTSAPKTTQRTLTGSSARVSADRTADRLGGCVIADRRDSRLLARRRHARRTLAARAQIATEKPRDEAHHRQQRRDREQRARPAAVDEVRVEAVRDDGGEEGRREHGHARLQALGAPERVAPQAREEDVRRQGEQRARDPDAAGGVGVQHVPVLDGGEAQRRRPRRRRRRRRARRSASRGTPATPPRPCPPPAPGPRRRRGRRARRSRRPPRRARRAPSAPAARPTMTSATSAATAPRTKVVMTSQAGSRRSSLRWTRTAKRTAGSVAGSSHRRSASTRGA